jgi:hypothetical protein
MVEGVVVVFSRPNNRPKSPRGEDCRRFSTGTAVHAPEPRAAPTDTIASHRIALSSVVVVVVDDDP